MVAIIIASVLSLIFQLAVYEAIVLGISWIIGEVAEISVNYGLIGWVVFGIWFVVLVIKALFIYGAYKVGDK